MACKLKVNQLVKVNKALNTVEPVGDPFLFDGTVVDATTLVNCPETTYLSESVCIEDPADTAKCIENVKCVIAVEYDCVAEVTTTEVSGFVLPDGTSAAAGEVTVIACPEYQIVTDTKCDAGK